MAAPRRIPTGEGDGPLLPESHYAAAKLAGEALISGFASLYDWRAHTFRFGNTVGPRSNHGVVHDFVVKLLRDPTRLEILGDGTQAKPYIAVDDLVAGIRRGVAAAPRAPMTILNVGTEGTVTVSRVAAIVIEALGLAPDSVELAYTAAWSPVGAAGRATRPTSSSRPRRCGRSVGRRGCRRPTPSGPRLAGSPTATARRESRS